MVACKLLKTPLVAEVQRLFRQSCRSITVVSPFLSRYGLEVLQDALQPKASQCQVTILTSISVRSIRSGSLDVEALAEFCQRYPYGTTRNLPGLHAKAYIADGSRAIIASANLTYGGLVGNYEYGVLISDGHVAKQIEQDMREYSGLGAELALGDLLQLAEQAKALRALDEEAEKNIRATPIWQPLAHQINALGDNLLRQRVRGKTVNAIFSETIRHLLRQGPVRTEDLESQIQATHPDMCDDSIDRVIDGVHFGKKWKHRVRSSQQFLKQRGEIEYDRREGVWRVIG